MVELPDDNPLAMFYLLLVMHGTFHGLNLRNGVDVVFPHLVAVADKYLCYGVLASLGMLANLDFSPKPLLQLAGFVGGGIGDGPAIVHQAALHSHVEVRAVAVAGGVCALSVSADDSLPRMACYTATESALPATRCSQPLLKVIPSALCTLPCALCPLHSAPGWTAIDH